MISVLDMCVSWHAPTKISMRSYAAQNPENEIKVLKFNTPNPTLRNLLESVLLSDQGFVIRFGRLTSILGLGKHRETYKDESRTLLKKSSLGRPDDYRMLFAAIAALTKNGWSAKEVMELLMRCGVLEVTKAVT